MSKLLDDLVQQSRADADVYEVFLKKAEDLVKRLAGMYASIRFQGLRCRVHRDFYCGRVF